MLFGDKNCLQSGLHQLADGVKFKVLHLLWDLVGLDIAKYVLLKIRFCNVCIYAHLNLLNFCKPEHYLAHSGKDTPSLMKVGIWVCLKIYPKM